MFWGHAVLQARAARKENSRLAALNLASKLPLRLQIDSDTNCNCNSVFHKSPIKVFRFKIK